MPEGQVCNRRPVSNEAELKLLIADEGGKQYYEEMLELDVDSEAIWGSIQKSCKSRIKTWLEICAHCGMCAKSCFFYRINDQDPTQVPAYKIQSTLGEIIKRKGQVDNEFMRRCMDVAWSKCNCCSICSQLCPHGIDVGVMMDYLRGLLFSQGFVPWEMKIGSGMQRVHKAQIKLGSNDWRKVCEQVGEEIQKEWPGLAIAVDKEDADIMYTLSSRQAEKYKEDLAEAAILFHLAGENWTVPGEGWEQGPMPMLAGDWEACADNVKNIYSAMERLRPKRSISSECTHAYRASAIEGPYLAGLASGQPPLPYIHYVEWLAEALREGKIKIDPEKKIKEPVILHDSCDYVRQHSLGRYISEIMSYIAEDYREMPPSREYGYCCAGGIGKYSKERDKAMQAMREQIMASGAQLVISPCHDCWAALRDMAKEYDMGIKWSFLKPLIIKMASAPEALKKV